MYKKIIPLSLVTTAFLFAAEVELPKVSVESTVVTEVSQNAQVSADLATALSGSVPSIDMSRRSGIANDIYIRGQKRDNISVDVDGTKVCGACVNRMDPPISHVLANQINEVEVIEGPYDVENFGTMSGGVKIKTKKPTKELHGEVDLGLGDWGYKKVGATISGGNDKVRALVSGSQETSNQYRDGDGNTLSEQRAKYGFTPPASPTNADTRYADGYKDIEAYTKKSIMAKLFVNTADNQELRLGYTGNRSDDILYANSKMDAAYDDSNIYSIEYDVKSISDIYKNLNIQYYYSDVDHPMDTKYRNSGATSYMTNHLKTSMQGVKLKNSFDLDGYKFLVGLDGSKRTWEGDKYTTAVATGAITGRTVSLTHTQTDNKALFAKLEKGFGNLKVEAGARYDSTDISPDDITKHSNSYDALNSNILATYSLSKQSKLFGGFGIASRVPDARELYPVVDYIYGNENLKQTTNKELDFGYEGSHDNINFKIKTFYSMLEDYIYLKERTPTPKTYTFENIDATVYGVELTSSYLATDELRVDFSASYKKGKKDSSSTQSDRDLADMAPLRGKIALNYDYAKDCTAMLEAQMSDKWDSIDSSSGEQTLSGWSVLNAKVKHSFSKNVDLSVGINNILDETYIQSNSYVDLILLSSSGTTILLNEPGRYVYTNLTLKF